MLKSENPRFCKVRGAGSMKRYGLLLWTRWTMILLVWQPIGWISYKVQCKSQKKEK